MAKDREQERLDQERARAEAIAHRDRVEASAGAASATEEKPRNSALNDARANITKKGQERQAKAEAAAKARAEQGEAEPPPDPTELRQKVYLKIRCNGNIPEDKAAAIAAAAEALVEACREAGMEPQQADVSGTPF